MKTGNSKRRAFVTVSSLTASRAQFMNPNNTAHFTALLKVNCNIIVPFRDYFIYNVTIISLHSPLKKYSDITQPLGMKQYS
jgi:hypothetical protein